MKYENVISEISPVHKTPLHVTNYLSGVGHSEGTLSTLFSNAQDYEQVIDHLTVLPWFCIPLIHSIKITDPQGMPYRQ